MSYAACDEQFKISKIKSFTPLIGRNQIRRRYDSILSAQYGKENHAHTRARTPTTKFTAQQIETSIACSRFEIQLNHSMR